MFCTFSVMLIQPDGDPLEGVTVIAAVDGIPSKRQSGVSDGNGLVSFQLAGEFVKFLCSESTHLDGLKVNIPNDISLSLGPFMANSQSEGTVSEGGAIESIVAGDNIDVDNTDPLNPVVSSTGAPDATKLPLAGGTMDASAEIAFNNGSKLGEGGFDHGGGGGIAETCAVGYVTKWEAGSRYIMGDAGNTIREVQFKFTNTPSATDDETKRFIVGSRWVLDDGTIYVCTDQTEGVAVWVQLTGPNGGVVEIEVAPHNAGFPVGLLNGFQVSYAGFFYTLINSAAPGSEASWLVRSKVYLALISQEGTDDPTVSIGQNSVGAIVWTRISAGLYHGTLIGAFLAAKTYGFIGASAFSIGSNSTDPYSMTRVDDDTLKILMNEGDDVLVGMPIRIEVCP